MPRQVIPEDKEIMLIDTKKLQNCLNDLKPWTRDLITAIGLSADFQGPRPLLAGHITCVAYPSQVLILGGGAVCFAFGTFWNEGTWLLKRWDMGLDNSWAMLLEGGAEASVPRAESGLNDHGRFHINSPVEDPAPCPVPENPS